MAIAWKAVHVDGNKSWRGSYLLAACLWRITPPVGGAPRCHATRYSGKMVYWMYQMYSTTGIQKW